jgi:hypothetical protein
MQVNRHKVYENKKFRPKDLSNALISIMDELGIPELSEHETAKRKARKLSYPTLPLSVILKGKPVP